MYHRLRLTISRMTAPALTFWSVRPPCSHNEFTSWNYFYTSLPTDLTWQTVH